MKEGEIDTEAMKTQTTETSRPVITAPAPEQSTEEEGKEDPDNAVLDFMEDQAKKRGVQMKQAEGATKKQRVAAWRKKRKEIIDAARNGNMEVVNDKDLVWTPNAKGDEKANMTKVLKYFDILMGRDINSGLSKKLKIADLKFESTQKPDKHEKKNVLTREDIEALTAEYMELEAALEQYELLKGVPTPAIMVANQFVPVNPKSAEAETGLKVGQDINTFLTNNNGPTVEQLAEDIFSANPYIFADEQAVRDLIIELLSKGKANYEADIYGVDLMTARLRLAELDGILNNVPVEDINETQDDETFKVKTDESGEAEKRRIDYGTKILTKQLLDDPVNLVENVKNLSLWINSYMDGLPDAENHLNATTLSDITKENLADYVTQPNRDRTTYAFIMNAENAVIEQLKAEGDYQKVHDIANAISGTFEGGFEDTVGDDAVPADVTPEVDETSWIAEFEPAIVAADRAKSIYHLKQALAPWTGRKGKKALGIEGRDMVEKFIERADDYKVSGVEQDYMRNLLKEYSEFFDQHPAIKEALNQWKNTMTVEKKQAPQVKMKYEDLLNLHEKITGC
jgi:hypothetical protein